MGHQPRSYLLKIALIICVGGIGLAVMRTDRFFDLPLVPGLIEGGVIAIWILLLKYLSHEREPR